MGQGDHSNRPFKWVVGIALSMCAAATGAAAALYFAPQPFEESGNKEYRDGNACDARANNELTSNADAPSGKARANDNSDAHEADAAERDFKLAHDFIEGRVIIEGQPAKAGDDRQSNGDANSNRNFHFESPSLGRLS